MKPEPNISRMNRKQRRAYMRSIGHTWKGARAMAQRIEREKQQEAVVAAKASRLTPEEARKALAEWAARGGR